MIVVIVISIVISFVIIVILAAEVIFVIIAVLTNVAIMTIITVVFDVVVISCYSHGGHYGCHSRYNYCIYRCYCNGPL